MWGRHALGGQGGLRWHDRAMTTALSGDQRVDVLAATLPSLLSSYSTIDLVLLPSTVRHPWR
jgi:hypothetical protein